MADTRQAVLNEKEKKEIERSHILRAFFCLTKRWIYAMIFADRFLSSMLHNKKGEVK